MSNRHALVVGAGIVGIATASYLQRAGFRVTVIDYRLPGDGCSFGNGGIIASCACVPLAMPETWKQVPRYLLDPLGPLSIRLRYALKIAPWIVGWLRSGALNRVHEISRAMRQLNEKAFEAYAPLFEAAGATNLLRRSDHLLVSRRPGRAVGTPLSRRLYQEAGVNLVDLGPGDLQALEPTLSPDLQSGLLIPDQGYVLDPYKVVQRFAEEIVRQGGIITRDKVVGFSHTGSEPVAIQTSTETVTSDITVVAAGAWSGELARMLGTKIPLVSQRGYHVMVPRPGQLPTRTVTSADHRIGLTPMEAGLRIGGIVEIDEAEAPATEGRAAVLLRHAQTVLPGIDVLGASSWMGPRPSTSDGLPVIGRSPRHPSVFFAFGHGHFGLTGAAATGRLITDLVMGRKPFIDPEPYSPERFS